MLIADGAEAFAARRRPRCCANPSCAAASSARRATLVTTHYDWSVAAAQLERSLIDAAVADAATEPAFTRGAAAARSLS